MRYQLPRGYRRYLLGLAMLALLCIAYVVAATNATALYANF